MRDQLSLFLDAFAVILLIAITTAGIHYALELRDVDIFIAFKQWYALQYSPPLYLIISTIAGVIPAVAIWVFNPWRGLGNYGDAHWATAVEAKNMGLLDDTGIILAKAYGRYVRTGQPLSTLVLAPPGTGKTASVVIPTLLSCGNSMLINDIKGELYEKTSKRRSTFSEVYKLSPASSDTSRWNPLDKSVLPENADDVVLRVEQIANNLIRPNKIGGDEYWEKEARSIFIFYGLYLIHKNGGTSLPEIRSFALSQPEPQTWIAETLDAEEADLPRRIVEEGNGLAGKAEKEFSGVFGTFKSYMNVFADPYVQNALSANEIPPIKEFRRRGVTLYLTISMSDMKRLSGLLRLFFELQALDLLSEEPAKDDKTITLVLDEFVRLGYLQEIKDMPALSRSYKVNAMFLAQDYGQIEEIYGRDGPGIFDSTTAYKVIFTQNSLHTAERISNMIGKYTRHRRSRSMNGKDWVGSQSVSEEGVPLILPQEIMSMPFGECLVLAQNHLKSPIKAKSALWFKDKAMKKLIGTVEREAA